MEALSVRTMFRGGKVCVVSAQFVQFGVRSQWSSLCCRNPNHKGLSRSGHQLSLSIFSDIGLSSAWLDIGRKYEHLVHWQKLGLGTTCSGARASRCRITYACWIQRPVSGKGLSLRSARHHGFPSHVQDIQPLPMVKHWWSMEAVESTFREVRTHASDSPLYTA
jgi:hypothetical protein